MIPISRIDLDAPLTSRLGELTDKIADSDPAAARAAWRSAKPEKKRIRSYLSRMAVGIQRCMYCGDNLGTDIDHFEPIAHSPGRTFDWFNHLLACAFCNSNAKRDAFPCDTAGQPLLIDPTYDDPGRHLALTLTTGQYRALTPRGQHTIDVFGLNRWDLTRGRAGAFVTRRAVLCQAHALLGQGRIDDASECLIALRHEPHASVLYAMLLITGSANAPDMLGADVVAALNDHKIRLLLSG